MEIATQKEVERTGVRIPGQWTRAGSTKPSGARATEEEQGEREPAGDDGAAI